MKWLNFKLLQFAFALFFLVSVSPVWALPPGSTFNSNVSPHGNWTSVGSWTGSPSTNTCTPNGNDTYNIVTGDSIWTTCTNLSFTGGITINVKSGAVFYIGGNGAVTGSVTLNVEPGGKVVISGNLNLSGNSSVVVDGALTVGGSVSGNGSYVFDCNGGSGSGTVTINGSGCNMCTGGSSTNCVTLPVEFLTFTANYNAAENNVQLNWLTANEYNNAYFDIEKSYDGFAFSKIGSVSGSGFTSSNKGYAYTDEDANYIGLIYYRLKQVDFDGNSTYSSVLTVRIDVMGSLDLEIYPNPTSGNDFNVTFSNASGNVLLVLYDVHGNQLYSKTFTTEENGVLSAKELNTNLVSGIYYIHASNKGQLINKKLMVR